MRRRIRSSSSRVGGDGRWRRAGKVVLGLVGLLLLLPLSKCTLVHFAHDRQAQKLLTGLQGLALPPGAHFLQEGAEVGHYFGATGDATDVFAYRVFLTEGPEGKVGEFFAPGLKPSSQGEGPQCGVFRLEGAAPLDALPIEAMGARCPPGERGRAYVLYAAERCDEEGFWDIRGW